MIYSDLKPYTDSWESNLVEVCFTSKSILVEFSTTLKSITPSGKLSITENMSDSDNLFMTITLIDSTAIKYIKDAMKAICYKYDCEVLDY